MHFLYYVAVLVSALLLQGCVAATVAGTAAVGAKVVTDPRSIGTQVDDEVLELRVSSALSKDEQIRKEARIIETAYQGRVLLTGQSPDRELSVRARQIALGVDGVREVFNEIRPGKPVSALRMAGDAWLTTKIRSQLLAGDRVKASSVKVVTENSEVFLLGRVTEREGRAAADIASRVSGVKRVTTAFSYIR
ncbi:division/outer membrane stress-associated lipid-binding lipoprotein [Escherichia coli]|uniref:division/outer membrane stress-associated lipid-binding lipoprotein n=1 Tax=Escherichia coli TaxID=562 RepID=UPI0010D1E089|nr:division/outer membrane stress-associated lipid-binding lipoprotein [Escherichia coli]GDM25499.1 outer membrane lipoprotein [Escherichia coli]